MTRKGYKLYPAQDAEAGGSDWDCWGFCVGSISIEVKNFPALICFVGGPIIQTEGRNYKSLFVTDHVVRNLYLTGRPGQEGDGTVNVVIKKRNHEDIVCSIPFIAPFAPSPPCYCCLFQLCRGSPKFHKPRA